VGKVSRKFPTEFAAFESCLDKNDYRMGDCRATEKALLDCWNNDKGYTVAEATETA
jgi:hypothetical protein